MVLRTTLPLILLLVSVQDPSNAKEELEQRLIGNFTNATIHQRFTKTSAWDKCIKLAIVRNQCLPGQECPITPTQSPTVPTKIFKPPKLTPRPKIIYPRLPNTITPEIYDLQLQANMYKGEEKSFSFNGSVGIRINCQRQTNVIKIHAFRLDINKKDISVADNKGSKVIVQNVTYIEKYQWYVIKLTSALRQGKQYMLKFKQFSGPLKRDFKGLYLSSYLRRDRNKFLAISTLEPIFARKVFPCFDEPSMKAKFRVTLFRKNHFHSVSNMPREKVRSEGTKWKADIYKETLRMPTYLLSFVISDLRKESKLDSKRRIFRILARPEAVKRGKYALQTGVKILDSFEKYLNMECPLKKIVHLKRLYPYTS